MYFIVFIFFFWFLFIFILLIKIEKKIGYKCVKDCVLFVLIDIIDIVSFYYCLLEYFIESFYIFNYLIVDVEY